MSYDNIEKMLKNPKLYAKLKKDPAAELSLSTLISLFELQQLMGDAHYDIEKGERLYFAGLKEMYPAYWKACTCFLLQPTGYCDYWNTC